MAARSSWKSRTSEPAARHRAVPPRWERTEIWPTKRFGIDLVLNRRTTHLDIEPWTTLLDALREQLHMTGTKKGCDHGQCGACTVLVDGERINSCLALAVMQDGKSVTTIETARMLDGRILSRFEWATLSSWRRYWPGTGGSPAPRRL